ncbi:hypothetical protein Tco_0657786 [Tanacetum coccineum]
MEFRANLKRQSSFAALRSTTRYVPLFIIHLRPVKTCANFIVLVHSRKHPLHLKDLHHHRSMLKKNAQERGAMVLDDQVEVARATCRGNDDTVVSLKEKHSEVAVAYIEECAFESLCLAAIVSQNGRNAWWYMSVEELLPKKYPDKASGYTKGTDTMDVPINIEVGLEALYLAYSGVITHRFVLYGRGNKRVNIRVMLIHGSVIEGGKNQEQEPLYGADVLRIWVSSVTLED